MQPHLKFTKENSEINHFVFFKILPVLLESYAEMQMAY